MPSEAAGEKLRRRVLDATVAVVYVALIEAWVYGVLENPELSDGSRPHPFWGGAAPDVLFAVLHLSLGLVLGRWRALALLPVVAVLAVPAGFEPDGYPEVPIAVFLLARFVLFGGPLVALGVVGRKAFERRAIR